MNCVSGMTTVRGQNLKYPKKIFPDSPVYPTYFDLYSYPSHTSEIQPRKVEFISTPHISPFPTLFALICAQFRGRPPSQLWRYIILLPWKRKCVLFGRERRVQREGYNVVHISALIHHQGTMIHQLRHGQLKEKLQKWHA